VSLGQQQFIAELLGVALQRCLGDGHEAGSVVLSAHDNGQIDNLRLDFDVPVEERDMQCVKRHILDIRLPELANAVFRTSFD